ncbi:GNAT family N-acetyltransferase [Streptomyces sp. PmtG]
MNIDTDYYLLRDETPSVQAYLHLRAASGLSPRTVEQATAGLPHTWHAVTVYAEGEPVGMGRVVGDGGCVFQIVDMAVLPAHQGQGLGKRVMAALVDALERRAPAGAYVSLIADGDARFLYEKFGFRDTAPESIGMQRLI